MDICAEYYPETDLIIQKLIRDPRKILWECWMSPVHVGKFIAPGSSEVIDCNLTPSPGDIFFVEFDLHGDIIKDEGVYLRVVDEQLFILSDSFTKNGMPITDAYLMAIFLFKDTGCNMTQYTTIARFGSAQQRQHYADMGFFENWHIVASQFERYALNLHQSRALAKTKQNGCSF